MQRALAGTHATPEGERAEAALSGLSTLAGGVLAGGAARAAALGALRFYKRWISPLLPSACRFHPTCSEYMMQAIEKYGVVRGMGKGLLRLSRCHPFHRGGFDPVR